MISQSLALAWQFHRQERNEPSHRYLRWIYIVLMVFIVTLSQSSHSIQQYLTGNLASLLGADVVISHSQALSREQQQVVEASSQRIVETQTVLTTLTHNQQWQRVKLKGVANGYPLQGELKTSSVLGGSEQVMEGGPAQGDIWLDARLMTSLSVSLGDSLTISNQTFRVSQILVHEPDRLMEGHNVDMRAMVNLADFTRLNFASDLTTYRYLIAADKSQINTLIDWQKNELPAAQVFHKQGAHPLALFWKRVENFMGLASIVLFFMAAIAIEQLSQVQIRKEQYFSAVCMSLGASKAQSFYLSVTKWVLRVALLLPWVLVISGLCHFFIIDWLANTFQDTAFQGLTWQWNWRVAINAIGASLVVFLLAQIPVWYGLKQTSIGQLLKRNTNTSVTWLIKVCSVAILSLIAFFYSDNGLLTAMILGSVFVCVLVITLTSWGVLTFGEKLTKNVSGLLPFTLFMMRQRLVSKSTQILGVGLSAFLLLFTLMLMKDLGQTMSAYQRQHDGNLLISQASDKQMTAVDAWAQDNQIKVRQAKPFYYAKLIAINEQSLAQHSDKPSDTMATFQRAIRLHWTDGVPNNNRVLAGNWWSQNTPDWQQISVEEEVMTDLGLNMGDQLTFFINNQQITFTIVASHVYKPGAGSITFWVQMPASAHRHIDAAKYYMASLELGSEQFSLLGDLWQQYPTLRMVSLKEMTERFDQTLAMVTQVISGFSLLIIMLAIVVTVSSIQALEVKEKKKNSIILSFGFSRKTTLQLNVIEWIVTGAIDASGAILSTYLAGLMIYKSQFSLTYQPNFVWLAATVTIILLAVVAIGFQASKQSLSSSIRGLLAE